MKEFKPESILIRLSVERSAARLSEAELRRYQLEKIRNAEMFIADPDFIPEFTNDLTGDLLEMAWETIKAGIESARKKHFANPTGKQNDFPKVPIAPPKGTHSPPNTYIHPFIHSYNHSNNDNQEPDGESNQNEQNTDPGNDQTTKNDTISAGGKTRTRRFSPPSIEEISQYCKERNNGIDAEQFFDYYETRGWELKPGMKVKDWKACVRTWEKNQKGGNHGLSGTRPEDRVPGQRDNYEF